MVRPAELTRSSNTSNTSTAHTSEIPGVSQPSSTSTRTVRVWHNIADQPERQVRRSHRGGGLLGRATINAADFASNPSLGARRSIEIPSRINAGQRQQIMESRSRNSPADPPFLDLNASDESEEEVARPSPRGRRPATESLADMGQSATSLNAAMILSMRIQGESMRSEGRDDETYIPHNPGR